MNGPKVPRDELAVSLHAVDALAQLQQARVLLDTARRDLAALTGVEEVWSELARLREALEGAQGRIRALVHLPGVKLVESHTGAGCTLCRMAELGAADATPESHGARRTGGGA